MPLFFLHIHNGAGFIEDEEGLELSELEQARAEAVEGIRSILAAEVLQGSMDLRGRISIADAAGTNLAVVPFSEAVAVRLEEGAA